MRLFKMCPILPNNDFKYDFWLLINETYYCTVFCSLFPGHSNFEFHYLCLWLAWRRSKSFLHQFHQIVFYVKTFLFLFLLWFFWVRFNVLVQILYWIIVWMHVTSLLLFWTQVTTLNHLAFLWFVCFQKV